MAILWKLIENCDRLRRIREAGLDIIVPQYAIYFGDIKGSIAEGNSVGHVQSTRDGKDLFTFAFAGLTDNRIHFSLIQGADEQRALGTQR
jgi:hypothetical protein